MRGGNQNDTSAQSDSAYTSLDDFVLISRPCLGANIIAITNIVVCNTTIQPPVAPSM